MTPRLVLVSKALLESVISAEFTEFCSGKKYRPDYMVDAISPLAVPAALGLCYIAGYLGGFFGSLLASACLGQDAWWLGWPIMSVCQATVAFLLLR